MGIEDALKVIRVKRETGVNSTDIAALLNSMKIGNDMNREWASHDVNRLAAKFKLPKLRNRKKKRRGRKRRGEDSTQKFRATGTITNSETPSPTIEDEIIAANLPTRVKIKLLELELN